MISKSRLLLTLGVGLLVLSSLGKSRKQNRLQEKRLKKKEITTWEGEGGNLPPPVARPENVTTH